MIRFVVTLFVKRLVVGSGNISSDLVIVGEAPGAQEESEGLPFVGKSGKLLKNLLENVGINQARDVYFCNVIKSRPPNNRQPTNEEIIKHKPWLLQQIKLVDPKLVVLTGTTAMKAILEVKQSISSLRGRWIERNGIMYMAVYHPSYVSRFSKTDDNGPYGLTLKDFRNVRNKLYNLY